jgi:hypothetical protein
MRLIVHDTLATAPFVVPLREGWVTPDPALTVEIADRVDPALLGDDGAALAPVATLAGTAETHVVAPSVAVVAGSLGPISLRTPVRPDEVGRTAIRLVDVTAVGALLARATIHPFYGIEPVAWLGADAAPEEIAAAEAVVVEGADALRPSEAGYAEDLCRAWFILTGTPAVLAVLVVPHAAPDAAVSALLATFEAARDAAHERRREWRRMVAAAAEVPIEQLNTFYGGQELTLTAEARRGLTALLHRGGLRVPVAYLDRTSTS